MKDSSNSAPATWGNFDRRSGSAALQHIKVQGAVNAPGDYPFEENADVLHYLGMAGGSTAKMDSCKVIILRNYGPQRRTLVFKLEDAHSLPKVHSGDVLVFDSSDTIKAQQPHKAQLPAPRKNDIVELTQRKIKDIDIVAQPSEARIRGADGSQCRTVLEEYIRGQQFKRLLNQVAVTQTASDASSLAILSYFAGEGKSFFVAALALGYAKFLDSTVLILDTNRSLETRSPFLEAVAGDYTAPTVGEDIHREPASIDLLTTESLESEGGTDTDFYVGPYIKSLKEKYDVILVDTSAVSSGSVDTIDPIVVANQVDSSIIVTSPRSVHRSTLDSLSNDLRRFNLRVLGTVFNPMGAG